jgi:hypothetical protein
VVESSQRAVRAARSAEHWVVLAFAMLAPLGLAMARYLLVPSPNGHGTHEQLGLPPCRAIDWFGFPCPGCGVTTSFTLASRGELAGALATQPFGLVMFVLALAAAPWALWHVARGRDLYAELNRLSTRPIWIALGVLVVGSWIYKIAITLGA